MTVSVWIRLDGRDAFFGMDGYMLCLELRMVILGLSMLSMLLLSAWRLLLALMLELAKSLVVSFHWLMMVSHLLMLLMSGLMGSLVLDGFSGVGVAGCGVYAHASGAAWFGRRWGHLDLLPPLPDGAGEACRLYCSIPGPLQTVQRAEIWGVLAALQGCTRMHVGVDNLNVVRHVSRIIDGGCTGKPFPLVNDGDLLFKVQQFVRAARVTSVKPLCVSKHDRTHEPMDTSSFGKGEGEGDGGASFNCGDIGHRASDGW